jgi:hypothetical protein
LQLDGGWLDFVLGQSRRIGRVIDLAGVDVARKGRQGEPDRHDNGCDASDHQSAFHFFFTYKKLPESLAD